MRKRECIYFPTPPTAASPADEINQVVSAEHPSVDERWLDTEVRERNGKATEAKVMTTGEIPVSPALREAGAGEASLSELLSRDPEGFQRQDLDRIIEALREQRVRLQAAEGSGKGKSRKSPPGAATETTAKPEDLGL